jgi:hypothetical protein
MAKVTLNINFLDSALLRPKAANKSGPATFWPKDCKMTQILNEDAHDSIHSIF